MYISYHKNTFFIVCHIMFYMLFHYFFLFWFSDGLCHWKMCLWAYEDSESTDQPAHSQSDQCLHCRLTETLDTIECFS